METAENTIEIPLSVEDAHRAWLAFSGQVAAGQAAAAAPAQAEVPAGQLPEAAEGDKGTVYFHEAGPARTRVTMQLRYNPQALADAGQDREWLRRRLGMYLERYRAAAAQPQGA